MKRIPQESYGALTSSKNNSLSKAAKQVIKSGYTILDSKISKKDILLISNSLSALREEYTKKYGREVLSSAGENNIIRMPFTINKIFLDLAFNKQLINLVSELIEGEFILNQQNALTNKPNEEYSQARWHRDLPYQHFTTSKPIAISGLFCIDNFTIQNGATYILPESHKEEWMPNEDLIKKSAFQIEATSGQFIVMDSMAFHAGGINYSLDERRAVNHVFTIPFFKHQINIHAELEEYALSSFQKQVLGFKNLVPSSLNEFFQSKLQDK